jgi:hypothetical protein
VVGEADLGDAVTRAFAAVVALLAAAVLAAVAIDAGRWNGSNGRRPSTLAGNVAEHLLGAEDAVALRRGVRSFVAAERVPYGFDNGQQQSHAHAEAEALLADVAATTGPRAASQADDLLGVLAWGATQAPAGVLDPADQAVQAFTNAARLDPSNSAATFNLELALRALQGSGLRRGGNAASGPTGTGHSGASAGTPGEGY